MATVPFAGYIVLYLNVTIPKRIRFVVTPNIYDGTIKNDGVLFCQCVACDTPEQYASLKGAVQDIDIEYLREFIIVSKYDDDLYENAFLQLLQKTIAAAHVVASKHPWHWFDHPTARGPPLDGDDISHTQ
jgi:hypothetical protein